MSYSYINHPFCGCWYLVPGLYQLEKKYLPQVDLSSSTQILAATSRTTITQTFVNPSKSEKLDEVQYTFPLYDGVSVVGFQCTVASRTIVGFVKEKQQARADYKEAIDRGEAAGVLEQLSEASDVFTTKVGNVPAGEKIIVKIVYLGELKHDAETDGSKFTIPTFIAPRYGNISSDSAGTFRNQASDKGGISILVDVIQEEGSVIRGLQSPSHPIAVTMGRTSSMDEEAFENNHASATLTLGSTELDKDFVIVVVAKGQDTPRALLETHSSIPDQRAIMTTLVPKFNLPNIHPEIVFIVDRSGSMEGNIDTLVSAMKIFLKSLPVGVKFNICSFGSHYDFLFKKSKTYDETSMQEALAHLTTFSANYGGTEMLQPVKGTVQNRFRDMSLEVMLITDGEIWNQQELFDFINSSAKDDDVRFFSLGIGVSASSSLVEGIARAGNGFAQFVADNEKMDKRVIRMLKGALAPHIKDYSLEVKYAKEEDAMDDEFEIVESVNDSLNVVVTDLKKPSPKQKVISLFNKSTKEEPTNPKAGRYDHLPEVATPRILQAPHKIPPLYPFNRTTVYLLMSKEACSKNPKAVILRATSEHGPLELEIPIRDVGHGQTIHQLAAKKAVHELEQGRGWITQAKNEDGKLISSKFEGHWDEIVEREAVRLGVQFQVGGKWCSFVAVEKNAKQSQNGNKEEESWAMQEGSAVAAQQDAHKFGGSGGAAHVFGSVAKGGRSSGKSIFDDGVVPRARRILQAASTGSRDRGESVLLLRTSVSTTNKCPSCTVSDIAAGFADSSTKPSLSGSSSSGHSGSLFGSTIQNSSTALFGSYHAQSSLFTRGGSPLKSSYGPNSNQDSATAFGGSSAYLFGNTTTAPSFGFGSQGSNATPTASSTGTGLFGPTSNTDGLFANSIFSQATQADDFTSLARSRFSTKSASHSSIKFSEPAASNPALSGVPLFVARSSAYTPVSRRTAFQPMALQMSMQQTPVSAPAPYASRDAYDPNIEDNYQGTAMEFELQNKNRKMMSSEAQVAYKNGGLRARMSKFLGGPSPVAVRAKAEKEESDEEMNFGDLDGVAPAGVATSVDNSHFNEAAEDSELTDEQKMHALIDLQTFDGSWALDAALLAIVGVTKEQLAANLSARLAGKDSAKTEKAQATIAAIVWLETKVGKERDLWEMVVEKARAWVEGVLGGSFEQEEASVRKSIGA